MNFPKISIVTPSFNQGQFLEQTILSVLDQNYPNLEYIIIDGGSTDNSVSIIKKYESHLTYWVSEKDSGQSEAINKGLSHVTGEIFNWLNSDDYYPPGLLHEVALSYKNGIKVVCGKVNFIYPDGQSTLSKIFASSSDIVETISSTKYLQPCTFYTASFIKKINGVSKDLHYCMDLEIWLKYLLMYGLNDISINEKIIVNFRIHEFSKTGASNGEFEKDQIKIFISLLSLYNKSVLKKYSHILKDYNFKIPTVTLSEAIIREACAKFFFTILRKAYGHRDFALFDELYPILETTRLKSSEISEFNKIKMRRKLIPVWVYKNIIDSANKPS